MPLISQHEKMSDVNMGQHSMPHMLMDAEEFGNVEFEGVDLTENVAFESRLEGDEGGQNVCVWALWG